MVVVGGGILTEDTIWASSKGKSGFVKDGKNLLPTGKTFSFNQCHTKSFAFFSRESYCVKAIDNFFPVFA